MSAIITIWSEFKETINKWVGNFDAEIQDTQLDIQAMRVSADQWTGSFLKELDTRIQGTLIHLQAMKTLVQAMQHGLGN
jgi:hypothetical protein